MNEDWEDEDMLSEGVCAGCREDAENGLCADCEAWCFEEAERMLDDDPWRHVPRAT